MRSTRQALAFGDRKCTRLNSSHLVISYAVFCLKKKKNGASRAGSVRREQRSNQTAPEAKIPTFPENGASARSRPKPLRPGACLFFHDPAPTEIYTLSLHDALPI